MILQVCVPIMIPVNRSKDIRKVLARINKLFDQYYENGDDVMEALDNEVQLLRDHLWHEVDLKTAKAMDEEDGLDRPII